MSIIYNKTHVRWTTHNPSGLSRKDVDMATFCDEHGRDLGEIETPPDATVLDAAAQVGSADKPDQPNLGDMSRSLATEGGGCCKP
ncbi:MAG: hypothetical protein M1832_004663 [Thelocarpon impressellum]|nr:MAG: hypothetical protein M1832_004663 [Thelocarpon impressellum]